MKREDLIRAAGDLVKVSEKSTREFGLKREILVALMNTKMLNRPDIEHLVGKVNLDLMKDNHANHARFVESIFHHPSPEALTDTVLWVFKAYKARNFSSTYWAAQINAWIEIYKKELTAECFEEIYPYYNWMQIHIPFFNKLAEDHNLEVNSSQH